MCLQIKVRAVSCAASCAANMVALTIVQLSTNPIERLRSSVNRNTTTPAIPKAKPAANQTLRWRLFCFLYSASLLSLLVCDFVCFWLRCNNTQIPITMAIMRPVTLSTRFARAHICKDSAVAPSGGDVVLGGSAVVGGGVMLGGGVLTGGTI